MPDLTEYGSRRKTLFRDRIGEVERERAGDRVQREVESQAEKNKQRDTETERQTKIKRKRTTNRRHKERGR